jgi:shikimate kinase
VGTPVRNHIALVGLSGTGKTTIAPLLAERRGMAWVDLDAVIETERGMTAAELFASDGEDSFRDLEARLLAATLDGPPCVVATGGGAVVRPANRLLLEQRCRVVWLRADPGVLARRVGESDQDRPLLAGDAATALRALGREREPLYREVADLVVDVDAASPAELARAVDQELSHG